MQSALNPEYYWMRWKAWCSLRVMGCHPEQSRRWNKGHNLYDVVIFPSRHTGAAGQKQIHLESLLLQLCCSAWRASMKKTSSGMTPAVSCCDLKFEWGLFFTIIFSKKFRSLWRINCKRQIMYNFTLYLFMQKCTQKLIELLQWKTTVVSNVGPQSGAICAAQILCLALILFSFLAHEREHCNFSIVWVCLSECGDERLSYIRPSENWKVVCAHAWSASLIPGPPNGAGLFAATGEDLTASF